MSAHNRVELECDGCDEHFPWLHPDDESARVEARKEGWTWKQGRDLCPECSRRAQPEQSPLPTGWVWRGGDEPYAHHPAEEIDASVRDDVLVIGIYAVTQEIPLSLVRTLVEVHSRKAEEA